MPGYSGTPLVRKLGIKDAHVVWAALARRLPVLLDRTVADGMVWVCWPKKAAQRSRRWTRSGRASKLVRRLADRQG